MYEFTKREIRKKFKETEYGKKTNRWLYISAIITLVLFIIGETLGILYFTNVLKITDDSFFFCLKIFSPFFFIACVTTCYFDGKRDGAIEQFKRNLKKE